MRTKQARLDFFLIGFAIKFSICRDRFRNKLYSSIQTDKLTDLYFLKCSSEWKALPSFNNLSDWNILWRNIFQAILWNVSIVREPFNDSIFWIKLFYIGILCFRRDNEEINLIDNVIHYNDYFYNLDFLKILFLDTPLNCLCFYLR